MDLTHRVLGMKSPLKFPMKSGLKSALKFTGDFLSGLAKKVKAFALMSSDPAVYNQQDGRPVPQGRSVEFNGTNYITFPTDGLAMSSFEVEIDFTYTMPGAIELIADFRVGGGDGLVLQANAVGSLTLIVNGSATTLGGLLVGGAYNKVRATYDGANIELTLNGAQNTAALTGLVNKNAVSALATRPFATPTALFTGRISNFRFNDEVTLPLQGTTFDVSGNGNHATPVNSPTFPIDTTIPVDYLNENGFTEGNGSNGAAVGEYIPALLDGSADAAGNPLQWKGSAIPFQWGRTGGSCLSFNGTNRVDTSVECLLTSFSCYLLLRTTDSGVFRTLVSGINGLTTEGLVVEMNTSGDVEVRYGGYVHQPPNLPSINDGEWHRLSVVWDGSTSTITVDGIIHSVTTFDSPTDVRNLSVAGRFSGGNRFTGEISDVTLNGVKVPISEGAGSSAYASDGTAGTLVNSPAWVNTSPIFTNAEEGFSLLDTGARVAYVNGSPNPVTSGLNVVSEHPAVDGWNQDEALFTAKVADDGNYPPYIAQMDVQPVEFQPTGVQPTNVYWKQLPNGDAEKVTLVETSTATPEELADLNDYINS